MDWRSCQRYSYVDPNAKLKTAYQRDFDGSDGPEWTSQADEVEEESF